MILKEHLINHERLRPYFKGPMLLLGDQEFKVPFDFGCHVESMDIHGRPTYKYDLTTEERDRDGKIFEPLWKFNSVYNLGTLEHIWDYHAAFCNVLRMVEVGGYYLGHHPVAGYEGHGVHVTDPVKIMEFLTINDFKIMDSWTTEQNGDKCYAPYRNCGKSIILWLAAQKKLDREQLVAPVDLC